jgi:hypothetical protein
MGLGREGRLALALLSVLCGPAYAQEPDGAAQPAQIDRNGTLILIRSTLIALQQANETGNYTVLRDLGAPGFAQANNAARLGDIFADLRAKDIDLAGILVLDPQLTLLPQIDKGGLLRMAGFFPSVPIQINFDLAYAPVNGRWRPFGVSVRLGSASPVAPNPPQAAAPPVKPRTKAQAPKIETVKVKRKPHPAKPSEPLQLSGPETAPKAETEPRPETEAK